MSKTDTVAAVKTAPNLGKKMNQYRKKPVVITAVQFTKELRDAHIFDDAKLPDGVTRGASNYHPARREVYRANFYIKTLEGEMHVELDDWVITGVKGEHYPCKPDIFAATYEPANAAQESAPAGLPIKTWQERLREKFPETADRNLFAVGHLEHAMEAEIADLRAALSRPVVVIPVNWKEQALRQYRHNDGSEGLVFAYDFEVINRLLAAAPASPQPVAEVLTDEQILSDETLRYYFGLNGGDGPVSDKGYKIIKAVLALAASTPTTLTEKKE